MSQTPNGLDDPLQPVRAAATDAIVSANRKNVPASAVNQRSVPRMSVEELNNSSWEDVERRYNAQRLDLRPPFVKVLDLIDLPRNTNLNIAAGKPTIGGILGSLGEGAAVGFVGSGFNPIGAVVGAGVVGAEQAVAAAIRPFVSDQTKKEFSDSSETAAADQPHINFSDVLRKLGVENHAVAGIGGFLGDLATDPLILSGGTGTGLRVLGGGGKIVAESTKAGSRAFRGGLKAVAEGGIEAVRNPEVKELLRESGITAEQMEVYRQAGTTPEQILADIQKRTMGGAGHLREARPVKRFFGGSVSDSEGTLAKYFDAPPRTLESATEEAKQLKDALGTEISPETLLKQSQIGQASRNFFAKYGRSYGSSTKSLRFGTGGGPGTEIFHVPFTDLSVQVPGMFGKDTAMLAAAAVSGAKETAFALDPEVSAIRDITGKIVHHVKQGEQDADELARLDAIKPTEIMAKKAFAEADQRAFDEAKHGYLSEQSRIHEEFRASASKLAPEFLNEDESVMHAMTDAEIKSRVQESVDLRRKELLDTAKKAKSKAKKALYQTQLNALADEESNVDQTVRSIRAGLNRRLTQEIPESEQFANKHPDLVGKRFGDMLRLEQSPAKSEFVSKQGAARAAAEDAFSTEKAYHDARQAIIDAREGVTDAAGTVVSKGRRVAVDDLLGELRDAEKALHTRKAGKLSAENILHLNAWKGAVDAAIQRISTETVPMADKIAEHVALKSVVGEAVKRQTSAISRLVQAQTTEGANVRTFLESGPDGAIPFINPDRATIAHVSERITPVLDELQEAESDLRGGQGVRKGEAGSPGALFDTTAPVRPMAESEVRVQALRDQLRDMTAPLRVGELQPVDDVLKGFRQDEINRLNSVQRDLVDENSEAYKALSANIEARHAAIAAAWTLSNATESSIVNHLTSAEKDVVALANAAIGSTDLMTGASLFAPIGHAINDITGGDRQAAEFAFRADQRIQKEFGRRAGLFSRTMRNAERMGTTEMRRVYAALHNDYYQHLYSAMSEAGIPFGKVEEADSLATALAYELRLKAGLDLPEDQRFFTEAIDVKPGMKGRNAFTVLEEARQSGLLQNKDFDAALQKIAGNALYLWDELGDIAVADGYLHELRKMYVPLISTSDTSERIAQQEKNAAFARRSTYVRPVEFGADPSKRISGYQRVRMTDQTRFTRADGKYVRFFEGDRMAVQEFLDKPEILERLRLTDPPAYEQYAGTVQTIKEYDALPASIRPPMRQTDAFELNDLAASGRFAHLTGTTNLTDGFMHTSLIHLVSARAAAQQLSYAKRMLSAGPLAAPGVWIDTEKLIKQGQEKGAALTLAGGAKARVVAPGILEVGGERYRALNKDLFDWKNPMTAMFGDNLRYQKIYREPVASMLEKTAQAFTPENFGELSKAMDTAVGAWKSTTLLSASWEAAEVTGNTVLAWMSGAPFHRFVAHIPSFIKLFWYEKNPEALRKLSFTIAGETLNGEEMLAALSHAGVTDASRALEAVGMLFKHKFMALPGALLNNGRGFDSLKVWQRAKQVEENARPFAVPGSTGGDGLFRTLYAPWFAVNRKINNAMRASVFMAFLDAGHDAGSAAERTLHAMFDFEDLTKTEKSIRRFVLPFYSWVRANGVYQVHSMLTRPQYLGTVPKLQQAIEEMLAGDEKVPMHLRPAWLREQMATQIGKDPDSRWSLSLAGLTPQTDAVQYLQPAVGLDGVQQFLHYFAGSFNPVIKTPLEIGAHREFFSDRSIAPTVEEGDLSIPEHLLGQIRPLKELGIGSNQTGPIERGFEQGPGAGTARLLLAGRAQDFSRERTDRQLLRTFKDRENGIRQALNRAQRNGRSDTTLEASVQLMRLYDAMRDAGFEKEIPKWARSQLDRLQSAPSG